MPHLLQSAYHVSGMGSFPDIENYSSVALWEDPNGITLFCLLYTRQIKHIIPPQWQLHSNNHNAIMDCILKIHLETELPCKIQEGSFEYNAMRTVPPELIKT